MTDDELGEIGFVIGGNEYDNNTALLDTDRLKAGIEGARLGLRALEFVRNFFDFSQNEEFQTEVAIQNLKIFLGEKNGEN